MVAGSADPPGIEQLHKLLARRIVVPGAILDDQRQQLFERAVAIALGVQRQGEIEAGLCVLRIGCEFGAQRLNGSPVAAALRASSKAARALATAAASALAGGTSPSVCSARARSPVLM